MRAEAGSGKAMWLPAVTDRTGTVIAQRQTDTKSNETPVFFPLPDGLAPENTVVATDAARTLPANGHWPREHGTHTSPS